MLPFFPSFFLAAVLWRVSEQAGYYCISHFTLFSSLLLFTHFPIIRAFQIHTMLHVRCLRNNMQEHMPRYFSFGNSTHSRFKSFCLFLNCCAEWRIRVFKKKRWQRQWYFRQCEQKRDPAAAKSSAELEYSPPSHQCGLPLSKEHMTLKQLWPQG